LPFHEIVIVGEFCSLSFNKLHAGCIWPLMLDFNSNHGFATQEKRWKMFVKWRGEFVCVLIWLQGVIRMENVLKNVFNYLFRS